MSKWNKTESDLCTNMFSWPWQNYHKKHDVTSAVQTQPVVHDTHVLKYYL